MSSLKRRRFCRNFDKNEWWTVNTIIFNAACHLVTYKKGRLVTKNTLVWGHQIYLLPAMLGHGFKSLWKLVYPWSSIVGQLQVVSKVKLSYPTLPNNAPNDDGGASFRRMEAQTNSAEPKSCAMFQGPDQRSKKEEVGSKWCVKDTQMQNNPEGDELDPVVNDRRR